MEIWGIWLVTLAAAGWIGLVYWQNGRNPLALLLITLLLGIVGALIGFPVGCFMPLGGAMYVGLVAAKRHG
jgi:hypothetical protein